MQDETHIIRRTLPEYTDNGLLYATRGGKYYKTGIQYNEDGNDQQGSHYARTCDICLMEPYLFCPAARVESEGETRDGPDDLLTDIDCLYDSLEILLENAGKYDESEYIELK